MDITKLKAQIKSGNLDRCYIFTGPESEVMRVYVNKMAEVKNASVVKPDDLATVVKNCRVKGFVQKARIYVLRDCKDIYTLETLELVTERIRSTTDDIIVFIYSQLDKRSKLYKEKQDMIVDFEYMQMQILVKYIKKAIDLSTVNCERLARICEMDYSRILLEIDKIKQIDKNPNDVLDSLINQGIIYVPPADAIFDFVDAVLKYKPRLAFKLMDECYRCGEATLVMISNLYNNTKQLLQYQSYRGDNLEEATGLTPFQIKLARDRQGIYSCGDLVFFMRTLRNIERGIKLGEIEDSTAVSYALISLWS